MIDEKHLNKINFSGKNNLEKIESIWQAIVGDEKMNFDFQFWQSIIKNNPEINQEIKNLIMDYLSSKAHEDFYNNHALNEFFNRKNTEKTAEDKYNQCCLLSSQVILDTLDGKEECIVYQKVQIKAPVFFDQIIKRLISLKKNYLIQYGEKNNIFLGKKKYIKAIFSQSYGNVYRITDDHDAISEKIMNRLSIHLANQCKETL